MRTDILNVAGAGVAVLVVALAFAAMAVRSAGVIAQNNPRVSAAPAGETGPMLVRRSNALLFCLVCAPKRDV